MNQKGNALNAYQGKTKRVLTVCSAGLLRSATLQNYFIREHNYNARNCGTAEEYALIPISEALVWWADEVYFVNKENFNAVKKEYLYLKREDTKTIVLDIPDSYGFNDPILKNIIEYQLAEVKRLMDNDEYTEEMGIDQSVHHVYIFDSTKIPVDEQ